MCGVQTCVQVPMYISVGGTDSHVYRHTCMLVVGVRRCTCVQAHMYVLVCTVFNLDLLMCLVYFHISICTMCVPGAFRGQKRVSDPLEPRSGVMDCCVKQHVGARN